MKTKDHILQDIVSLTGDQAAGRLAGTLGAYKSAVYLGAELEANGLEPVNGDSYFQRVNVTAPRHFGTPKLVIAKKEHVHRRDFGESPIMSDGGHYTGRLLVIREDDLLLQENFAKRIVLIPQRPEGFDLNATVNAASEMGATALLVEYGEPNSFYKTVWTRGWRIPVFRIRKSLAQEMANMNGEEVTLSLPLKNESLPCQNVLGLLRGISSDFTLALTAHYDHVGDDPSGIRFPGARDNASGVATILAAIRELASEPLPFNILVAFLTGEEAGLWGAKHLLAHPPLPISAVINLDVIGSEEILSTMRLGHPDRNDWLAEMAAKILDKHGITAQWVTVGDDSSVFISAGIPTVGLGEQPLSGIHFPSDTIENLHIEPLLTGVQVILDIVKKLAESKNLI